MVFVCLGDRKKSTVLTDVVPGGSWSCSSVAATVSISGMVTGVATGTATIIYSLGTGCRTTATETVNPQPALITGAAPICPGTSVTLADVTSGGGWSSSGGSIVTSTSGTVTGVSAGTGVVTYRLGTGCAVFDTLTVNPLPAPIGGGLHVCAGGVATVSDATTGGTWSSLSTNISIGYLSGIVHGITTGFASVSYTVSGCSVITTETVNESPAAIGGAANGCAGLPVVLSDSVAGGTWNSGDTVIGVVGEYSGVFEGIVGGTVTITYTLPDGCSTASVLRVNPTPTAIIGAGSVCAGSTATLTDAVSGGTWSSSLPLFGSVNSGGVVTGESVGMTIISYTIGGCWATVTEEISPLPAPIVGTDSVCEAGEVREFEADSSFGYWSSIGIGVDSAGIVTGFAPGTAIVSFTLPTGCAVIKVMRVSPRPADIMGRTYVCIGGTDTLTDATVGGSWSLSSGGIASIGSATGIISGIASGTSIASYTLAVTGCTFRREIAVNPLPSPIIGSTALCVDAVIHLNDSTTGGVWVSGASGIAAIDSDGIVSGLTAGTALISYAVTNLCGTAVVTQPVTVNPLPDAGSITGPGSVCIGDTINLSASVPGGTWFVSNSSAWVHSGSVWGNAVGLDTVLYRVTNTCGAETTEAVIAVTTVPDRGFISGVDSLCSGDTVTLHESVAGGVWSATNGSVTVSNIGQVTAGGAGKDTIIYTVTNACGSNAASMLFIVMTPGECSNEVSTAQTSEGLEIYPNPSDGLFTVKLSSPRATTFRFIVIDTKGETVTEQAARTNEAFDVHLPLAEGIYYFCIEDEAAVIRKKIVITKE